MNIRTAHEYSRIGFFIFTICAALPLSCDAATHPASSVVATTKVQTRTSHQVDRHRHVSQTPGLQEVSPISNRILMLRFVNGRAFHETAAGAGADGRLETVPFDVAKAAAPGSYRVSSKDDAAYAQPLAPIKVGRKSKGTDFVNNQHKIEWLMEHILYLALPHPLQRGKSYTVSVDGVLSNTQQETLSFDERKLRSETVHVNQIGYVPTAPQKFAYLSAWMGDMGPLALDEYSNQSFT
jgi:hypothetical protein